VTDCEVQFDTSANSLDAVQRAAYKFSDRLSSEVTLDGSVVRCLLHFSDDSADGVDATVADFRNEVLDQTLRERIRGETQEVRNLILALAFANTGLVEGKDK
jgi:His-Xaa-Ser system protein HxsD